jgi:DNA-binding SARP family transcriptional activator/tetratricopeptide (TPR) repeat protein
MKFGLLGPLTITSDEGQLVEIRGRKIRVLVATLLCRANQPVAVEALVDALWGLAPPRQAGVSLRVYVHHLRQALGESRIDRRSEGYRLLVRPDELDVERFRALVSVGRDAMSCQDPAKASELFRSALALWRGSALAGFDGVDALAAEAYSLEELRLDVLEQRFEAELSLGWHSEISAELRALSTRYPFRETIRAQLMRALVGSGRSAEAVAVFDETRRTLADELGLDPGPQLRELHLSILRDDPTLQSAIAGDATEPTPATRATAGDVVPRQLPAQLTGFVGRSRHLRQLDVLLFDDGDRPVAMPIATISGTAGIGKTTMAVHWAHHAADRFPDGQLYINLHGFDPIRSPVEPAAALGHFLAALGVAVRRIPVSVEERESLYRSLLADRRVLVVLDNAHDANQVRPLLPGNAGCFVLVTSRNLLAGLVAAGARPIVLDLLTPDEARHLLSGRLGVERIAAEPSAVADIVARCGGLPLPLSIVAAQAAVMAEFPLSALAAELGQARHTLDSFASDDATIDLRAVFSCSYRVLSDSAARMFRLLALHPGPDATAPAATSLAGVPAEQARSALAELSAANLLTVASPGRYAYHDLVRAYAIELAESHDSAADRRDAIRRVLDHYLHTAYPATLLLEPNQTLTAVDPPQPGVAPEALADRQQALAWFEAEHATIVAAVAQAADGFETHAWQLAWSAVVYLDRSGHWRDKIAVLRDALAAARRADEQTMEARTLRSLGRTYGRLHQYDKAYESLREAISRYRDLGNMGGQALSVMCCTEILVDEGRYPEALAMSEEAYELSRSIGNRRGEGRALGSIGYLHAQMGEYEQAIEVCQRALELFVKIDDPTNQAAACDSLGVAYQNLGLHREAVAHYRRALDLLEETGERFFVAIVLSHLGEAYQIAGEIPAARHAWQQALAIFTKLGAREAQGLRDKLVALDDTPAALVAQTKPGSGM